MKYKNLTSIFWPTFSVVLIFVFSLFSFAVFGQDAWTNKKRALPDDLRKVPVALHVMHNPNPNYPERTAQDDNSGQKYVWQHSTTFLSPEKDLEVIKVGSYIWYNESGWQRNVEYNKKAVAKRFQCKKGKIQKGITYTFEKNYRYGNQLYGGDALWYILAKDSDGNVYKGMAILETEAEIIKEK